MEKHLFNYFGLWTETRLCACVLAVLLLIFWTLPGQDQWMAATCASDICAPHDAPCRERMGEMENAGFVPQST
jgi:hypothetical protein